MKYLFTWRSEIGDGESVVARDVWHARSILDGRITNTARVFYDEPDIVINL